MPTVSLPHSKSISARVMCLDYLSGGVLRKHGGMMCRDEQVLMECLRSGAALGEAFIGESGTALRLLTAIYASKPGVKVFMRGEGRVMNRPMKPLLDALLRMGARIDRTPETLTVHGSRLTYPCPIKIDASISSQFITALLLIGPMVKGGLVLQLQGEPVSLSYIEMTMKLMAFYGAPVSLRRGKLNDGSEVAELSVNEGDYSFPETYVQESDWSAASYFYALAAAGGERVAVDSLTSSTLSLQGDAACEEIYKQLGVITKRAGNGLHILPGGGCVERFCRDMRSTPDLVPTVVSSCVAMGVPFEITGVGHLRDKESDREQVLIDEFGKMGVHIEASASKLWWDGKTRLSPPSTPLNSHGDHRMAMAFASLATRFPIPMEDSPAVVEKSFPGFWQEMKKVGFSIK